MNETLTLRLTTDERDVLLHALQVAITRTPEGGDREDFTRLENRVLDLTEPLAPLPNIVRHYKTDGPGALCGAALVRGNSYYEWAYVNCQKCRRAAGKGA